jgi:hypothetical protein
MSGVISVIAAGSGQQKQLMRGSSNQLQQNETARAVALRAYRRLPIAKKSSPKLHVAEILAAHMSHSGCA